MSDARIIERGYRRYDGPRLGAGAAVRSLWTHTIQRSLGLRRSFRFKIVPILTLLLAYLPAIVFIGITALLGLKGAAPTYPQYYNFIGTAIFLFCAIVGPDALCPDRRFGVLSLYLSSPLTRIRYLTAKGLATATVILGVTLGPLLLLLIGLSLQGVGPKGAGNLVLALGRILASGCVVAFFYTLITMAASSLTDRRGYATAGFFLAVLLTGAVTGIIVVALKAPTWLTLLNLGSVPTTAVNLIFGQPIDRIRGERGVVVGDPIEPWMVVVAYVAWMAVALAIIAQRYRKLQVTR